MNKLNELSISDLKASGEYLEQLKRERKEILNSKGIESKLDKTYISLEKLEFDIHNQLLSTIMKLRK